jgi:hypothetical protein
VLLLEREKNQAASEIAVADSLGGTFLALHKLMGVESVRKIETGLECVQWLPRKLRNTVLLLE